MNFQEGTVVTTQINHPPVTLSGVVIASKKIDAEADRTFEVFKVMFQNESKNVGTYVWCSESLSYAAPDNNSFRAELIYAGEKHNMYCPQEVRRA